MTEQEIEGPLELMIIGFNGTPVNKYVGLKTPIAFWPDVPSAVFKLGVEDPSVITKEDFEAYSRQGRLTKLPEEVHIQVAKDHPENIKLHVGYIRDKTLHGLNDLGTFEYEDQSIRFEYGNGVLRCSYQGRDGNDRSRTINLAPLRKGMRYWIGNTLEQLELLNQWSQGFCNQFDREWIEQYDVIAGLEGKTLDEKPDVLNSFEDIAWRAGSCGIYDRKLLMQAYVRLFAVYLSFEQENIAEKRFDGTVKMLFPNETWDHFRGLVYQKLEDLRTQGEPSIKGL